jgi:hypothetical protein
MSGPQGVLWFTNGTHSVGEITTSGTVTIASGPVVSDPTGIAPGRNSSELWFTDFRDHVMSEGQIR